MARQRRALEAIRHAASTRGSPEVVQRNAVLKHEYSELENPAYTVARHLSWATGQPPAQVLQDIDWDVPHTPTLARPDRVVAYVDHVPGGGVRVPFITQVGKLGYLEEALRGRRDDAAIYDGGHLLALSIMPGWVHVNDARNLAPQRFDDNEAPGRWRQAETSLKTGGGPLLYESSVSYPDRTYTVTAGGMARALTPGSPTALALAAQGLVTRWTPTTVHTWTPSQFALAVSSLALASPTVRQTPAGWDPTNWLPVLHRLASPLKGTIARLVPLAEVIEHHRGIGGVLGGMDVRTAQNYPPGDALNEVKQLALDLAKVFALVEWVLPRFGIDSATILAAARSLPGMSATLAFMPGFLAGSPLAAIILYGVFHQTNVSRLLPEWPGLDWLKYLLRMVGL